MRIVISICFIFLIASCSQGPSEGEISEPEKIVNQFFDVYKNDGPKTAIRRLLLTNKYISEQSSDSVANQMENWAKNFDDYQGYEVTSLKKYGQGILFITCIAKYSKNCQFILPSHFTSLEMGGGFSTLIIKPIF